MKARQDALFKSRVLLETEMTIKGVKRVDGDQVNSYCSDLRSLLSETEIVKSKAFLQLFIEKVIINGSKCTIHCKLPVPANWQRV
ncbi:MAG: hypothetical protein JW967_09435 [Dehalococcoidales bacterium]|nr:hypothetical protein [Dehalococcoidales bacterium]